MVLAFGLGTGFTPAVAQADVQAKNLLAAVRALTFLENPPHGTVDLGIIRDPADADSVRDADAARSIIGQGLLIGDLTVRARMLSPEDVSSANGLAALLVTGRNQVVFNAVAALATGRSMPVFSVDPACIEANACALWVKSEPRIQLFINSRVAQRENLRFTQTFSMMVKDFQ
jgi:hypothetical protein